ncbi:MAG: hypothetical protein ABI467_04975 [Kofleriaceae bacterium]
MTRLVPCLVLALSLPLVGTACGNKGADGDHAADHASKSTEPSDPTNPAAPAASTIQIHEADWVVKDLHAVAPLIHVSMKVPRAATLEKNGNGGVDIKIADAYMLTVGAIAVASIDEAKQSDKSLTVANASSYINGKVLSEEPNGFIYTMQMKTEDNGHTYQPEAHFAYYLNKDGAIYSILDQRPLEAFSAPGSTYSEALAKQVYALVKGSAKAD